MPTPEDLTNYPPEDLSYEYTEDKFKAAHRLYLADERMKEDMRQAERNRETAQSDQYEEARRINRFLYEKGLIKQLPMGNEMNYVGAPGTESNEVLEYIQELVGLYPEETALPPGHSDKRNAGNPTALTMAAINALPDGDGTKYTASDIAAARQAVADLKASQEAAAEEQYQEQVENASEAGADSGNIVPIQ